MADDVILVEYQAKIDKFEASLRALEKSMLDAEATAKKSSAAAGAEYTKQTGIINNLKSRVNELTAARDRSNNPAAIQRYNKLIEESSKKVQNLTKATQEVVKEQGGLSKVISAIGPQILAAFSVGAILAAGKSVIDVTSQFQKLEAVLTNTLGSKSKAQNSLALIKDFAAKTNFSVLELSEGFVKLANQGFVPTRKELTKLADLANSTGKGFNQLVEGILDAQTGEYERLKDFGIKAKDAGDKVAFTFKNQTTLVEKNSEAIKQYVLSLGELNGVAGSTTAISETLGGKISNLGDAFDNLWGSIGGEGSGIMGSFIELISNTVTSLAETIKFLSNPFQYDRDAAKESYEKAVNDQKEFYEKKFSTDKDQARFEVEVELLKIQELGNSKRKFTEEELTIIRNKYSALALMKQEFDEAEKASIENAQKNQKGLIKKLTSELSSLKQQEEEALTEIEIRSIQEREKVVQAELDRLLGKKNKEAEDQRAKEKKFLEDSIKEYHEIVKNAAENDAFERAAIDKKEKESLKESEKEYHEFVSNQAEQEADARRKREKEEIEDFKRKQAIKKQILSTAIDVSGTLINELNQRQLDNDNAEIESERSKNDTETESLIASLEKRKEQGLLSETSFASQKAAILRKSARQESELKKRAFEAQKQADLTGILINTAVAIAKSFAVYGFTPAGVIAAAAAAAEGAVQYAFVSSKKTPKFKEGGEVKGKSHSEGGVHIEAEGGEYITKVSQTKKYKGLLQSINNDTVEKYLTTDYLKPIMAKQKKEQDRETSMLRSALNLALANQVDTSHLERLTKRNGTVNLGNAREIGKIIASEINGNNNPEMK